MQKIIVKCEIINGGWGETNKVSVGYSDGSSEILITYFSDELFFTNAEFIGLTREQAISLYEKRDKAYLQS